MSKHNNLLNAVDIVEEYIEGVDWKLKENATISYSIGGSILHNANAIQKEYSLEKIYVPEIREAHEERWIHIHDLSFLGCYCMGWSLSSLIEKGIVEVGGKTASGPAKHLDVICNQIVNFMGIMANESAGAQAFSSVDTYLAAFIKKDNLPYKKVKQCVQNLIFGLNFPNRWGSQPPFTNFTLDWTIPNDLANKKAIVAGEEQDFTYGECEKESRMFNKAFLEIMLGGDYNGSGFQYPIPTYSISKDFNWDKNDENNKLLFEITAKYGTPYFANYVNSDMDPGDVRSMCCRLNLDLRELRRRNGGYFGSGDNTGSIGVVTLNLPRIARASESKEHFFSELKKYCLIAKRSLILKKEWIKVQFEKGLYPYTKKYLDNFDSHFLTIGVVGGNEMCINSGYGDISTPEGKAFAEEVLDTINVWLSDFQEESGELFNLEATPAESTAFRFARKDREDYGYTTATAGEEGEIPYYTNSTHLPVGNTSDIIDALEHQDSLQTKYTSGTVLHGFLGEKISDWTVCMSLVKKVTDNFKLPYFTISPTYSVCPSHGYRDGEQHVCPDCGSRCNVYSRITGYYRPLDNWNAGKRQEFEDREEYKVDAQSREQ